MFGYIRPFKPQMRMMEFDTYKAVYCGMCHQLGKEYGPIARLTLSYDFTFLALLELALAEETPRFSRRRCYANPLKKKYCCQNEARLLFSCACAMVTLHYKLLDNLADGRWHERLGARLTLWLTGGAYRRAADAYPVLEKTVAEQMRRQREVEESRCASPDRASEPTAQAMAAILSQLDTDPAQKRVLERFGYLLGRWVYLMDALDDLPEDLSRGGYNPFALQDHLQPGDTAAIQAVREQAKSSLRLTAGELEKTFLLLRLNRYQSILQNFVEYGFRNSIEQVLESQNAHLRERNGQIA